MGIQNKGKRRGWTKREDEYLKFAVSKGDSFASIGRFLTGGGKACSERPALLLEREKDEREKKHPKIEKDTTYLRQQGDVVYLEDGKYMVNFKPLTAAELSQRAERIRANTQLLYGG